MWPVFSVGPAYAGVLPIRFGLFRIRDRPLLGRSRLRRSCGDRAFRSGFFLHGLLDAFLYVRARILLLHVRARSFRAAAAGGVFLAVDRPDMRGIAVEIGTPDAEILAVGIDPFPEGFGRNPALRLGRALGADDVGRKPVAIAAAGAAAVI